MICSGRNDSADLNRIEITATSLAAVQVLVNADALSWITRRLLLTSLKCSSMCALKLFGLLNKIDFKEVKLKVMLYLAAESLA